MTQATLSFSVPGDPLGKERPRVGRVGNAVRMFTPAKTKAYERKVALSAKAAIGPGRPLEGPLFVQIEAVHRIPASWSKKRRQEAINGSTYPTVKPDTDNIAKAIADGGNGVAWVDDRQIVLLVCSKRYGETPQVNVLVLALSRHKTAIYEMFAAVRGVAVEIEEIA